jgi:hypothetical protein
MASRQGGRLNNVGASANSTITVSIIAVSTLRRPMSFRRCGSPIFGGIIELEYKKDCFAGEASIKTSGFDGVRLEKSYNYPLASLSGNGPLP